MKQHSISSGELITWTKSFKCGGMEGVDVAALLQRCLRARRLRVHVRVLLNDTTGTLVAGAQLDPRVGVSATPSRPLALSPSRGAGDLAHAKHHVQPLFTYYSAVLFE